MRRTILWCAAALVFLGGLSGCAGGDKRTKLIRQMIESMNEIADILSQIKDADGANHYKVRLKSCLDQLAKAGEEMSTIDKPEKTVKQEYRPMTERLISLRRAQGRELTVEDVKQNLELGKSIPKADAQDLLDQINSLYGSFERFENDIKISCRRVQVEIVRLRLGDSAVWEALKDSLGKFKEPDFTIDEISPGLYRGQWLIDRLVLPLKNAAGILQTVKDEATANAAKPQLPKLLNEMTVLLQELNKMSKVLSMDGAELSKKYGEVQSLKATILGQKGRIQAGIVPGQEERDPRMWPVLKEFFDAFDELDFDWKPPEKNSGMMGGMGGMPGMGGMAGKGGMGGMQGGPPGGMAGMQGGPPGGIQGRPPGGMPGGPPR